jgi:hypothetical protein
MSSITVFSKADHHPWAVRKVLASLRKFSGPRPSRTQQSRPDIRYIEFIADLPRRIRCGPECRGPSEFPGFDYENEDGDEDDFGCTLPTVWRFSRLGD